ncbi:hypothetical protein [Cellulomonas aerilata]|uniref:Uncharacterized protein n=1 Tax=Cellulomonas aerilata TaxID=515326 RepID=A0A512D9V9_9CELL|nr:hypothetical protein [Cellulomonas aerilata]GEO33278.1 hypothetical protein CAE01nite_10030 [Cellulomonas aerilata]
MSSTDPFLPGAHRDDTIAAADPGVGAPQTAPGFGVEGEDPDIAQSQERDRAASDGPVDLPQDVPFRTPDPDDVSRR